MKRFLIFLGVLLLGGAWVGQAMMEDSGYVLVAYKNTSIETSLWVLLIAIVVLFAIVHWFFNLMSNWRSPAEKLRRWSEARHERKAGEKMIAALDAEVRGDLWKARRLYIQAADQSKAPALLLRHAAHLATMQGDSKEADRIIKRAIKTISGAEDAFLLESAKLDLKSAQYEKAAETLRKLQKRHPSSTAINRELASMHASLHQWKEALHLLPDLQKRKAITAEDLSSIRRDAGISQLSDEAISSIEQLDEAWKGLSYEIQQESRVKQTYIGQLTRYGGHERAIELIKKWLNNQWNEDLVLRFGELASSNPEQQIKTAKGWLKQHPENAALELTLARLERRAQLWGAAISHYKQSYAINPQSQTLLELAELYLQLGETKLASTLLNEKSAPLQLPIPSETDRNTRKHITLDN